MTKQSKGTMAKYMRATIESVRAGDAQEITIITEVVGVSVKEQHDASERIIWKYC